MPAMGELESDKLLFVWVNGWSLSPNDVGDSNDPPAVQSISDARH
jgi:hypothetical protein